MDRPHAVVILPGEEEFGDAEWGADWGAEGAYIRTGRPALAGRAPSPFLVQLIANRLGLAETRAKRRAEPEVAARRYDTAGRLAARPQPGRRFARSA